MKEDNIVIGANTGKDMTLRQLVEDGYLTAEQQVALSKQYMIHRASPSIVSWFFKRDLEEHLLLSKLSESVSDQFSDKKKKEKETKREGLLHLFRGEKNANGSNK